MKFSSALAASAAAHAILLACAAVFFGGENAPDAVASIDISAVELSLGDEDVAQEYAASSMAASGDAPNAPEAEAPQAREDTCPATPSIDYALEAEPPSAQAPDALSPSPANGMPKPRTPARVENAPSAQSLPATRAARIDAPAKLRRTIKPDYPASCRMRREEGAVTLEIEIAADGLVSHASVASSSGYRELDEAALKAVKAARFSPARSGRRPVASTANITLDFRLDK